MHVNANSLRCNIGLISYVGLNSCVLVPVSSCPAGGWNAMSETGTNPMCLDNRSPGYKLARRSSHPVFWQEQVWSSRRSKSPLQTLLDSLVIIVTSCVCINNDFNYSCHYILPWNGTCGIWGCAFKGQAAWQGTVRLLLQRTDSWRQTEDYSQHLRCPVALETTEGRATEGQKTAKRQLALHLWLIG